MLLSPLPVQSHKPTLFAPVLTSSFPACCWSPGCWTAAGTRDVPKPLWPWPHRGSTWVCVGPAPRRARRRRSLTLGGVPGGAVPPVPSAARSAIRAHAQESMAS